MFENICNLYGCKRVYGPYIGSDGRKRCVLYFRKWKTISKSYARLMIEETNNCILDEGVEVDHVNTDPSDDDFCNLQVLLVEEHRKKSALENSLKQDRRLTITCPNCGTMFKCPKHRLKHTDTPCCSRSCSSKFNGANQYGKFVE